LGESYQEEMLHQNYLAQQVGPGPDGHTEVMQPISQGSLHRWKAQMSPFDLKLADRIAGSLLEELTYESSISDKFTLSELPRFLFLGIKYIFSSLVRKILYSIGFLTLNRNMRTPDSED
jgi:hypothetical protein